MDWKKELKAEKLRKKAAVAKAGVKELIDLANQIGATGDPRDIEDLIGKNKKQAATLDSIADETAEMELVEEMAALKAKLTVSSKKLCRQHDEMQDQGWLKPLFGRDPSVAVHNLSLGHWYSDQSPGGNWADEVEEEMPRRREYQPRGRPRWNEHLEPEEDKPFIRGAYRDPFLQVLDKLANRMDRPARPAPPAWPVITDKYQDFPKWRKDIMSYL